MKTKMSVMRNGRLRNYATALPPEARIKLDLTINPIGCPDILDALCKAELTRYPEPAELPELVQMLAKRSNLQPGQIMLTAGADQAIEILLTHLLERHVRLGILVPTFPRFEIVAKTICDAEIVHFRSLQELPRNCQVIFLCTPNNPTTEELDMGELEQAIGAHPEITFLIDAVFEDFGSYSVSPLIRFSNVAVIKSLSKSFGLPGLRVGWIESQQENIKMLHQGISPFRVPLLCQRIVLQAMSEKEHIQRTITFLSQEFAKIKEEFGACVIRKSNVPFFVFFTEKPVEARIKLLEQGISVVDSTCFPGAVQGFLRIAIGTEAQNTELVAVLKKLIKGENNDTTRRN